MVKSEMAARWRRRKKKSKYFYRRSFVTKENTVKQTVKPVDRQPGQQTTRLTDRHSLETGIPPTATRNNLTGSTGNP